MPVVLTDTGYLFPETYQFIDELTERLALNLKIYRAELARLAGGPLLASWGAGVEGSALQPAQQGGAHGPRPERAGCPHLVLGLRREQSRQPGNLPVLAIQRGRFKFLPVIDWSNKDVFYYFKEFDLPHHPCGSRATSRSATHTTAKWEPGMSEEQTRFFGLKRECGLHGKVARATAPASDPRPAMCCPQKNARQLPQCMENLSSSPRKQGL